MMLASLLVLLCCAAPQDKPVPQVEVELHFVGLQGLSAARLSKAAELDLREFRERGQRRSALDDAAYVMEETYRSEGYRDARVDWALQQRDGVAHATFTIREGPQLLLGTLAFPGASALREVELAGLLGVRADGSGRHPYRGSEIDSLPGMIRGAYWQLGFLDVAVESARSAASAAGTRVDVTVPIHEGVRYVVREIRFEAPGPLPAGQLQEAVAGLIGLPFVPQRSVEVAREVRRVCGAAAYPDATAVVEEERDTASGEVRLRVSVDYGARTSISHVEVVGVERTREDFVRRRLGVADGDAYDRERIDEAFLRLFRTGLFRSIRLELGEPGQEPSERPLVVTVEESPAKELSLRGGYGSYEGLRVGTSFVERNLFGTARRFRASVDASQVGWAGEIGWTDPWLFQSEVELDVPVYVQRRREPSFTREESGIGLDLSREFGSRFRLSGGWGFRRSRISAVDIAASSQVSVEDVDIASFHVQPDYDSRNDPFNPTTGSLARLRVEWAGDQLLGSDLSFLRTQLDFARLVPLDTDGDLVLALGWRGGAVWPLGGTESLPLQERFFNGGEDSVRSFRESELGPLDAAREPLGGQSFHTANLELRQRLKQNLWSSLFVDAGNVGFEVGDLFSDLRYGVGTGLHYLLPVGAVRLDLAVNPDRREGEPSFQLFLTVGLAF